MAPTAAVGPCRTPGRPLAYIDVVDAEAGHFGAPDAGVDEEPDDRVVAPVDERLR